MKKKLTKKIWNCVYKKPRHYIKESIHKLFNLKPYRANFIIIDNFEPSFLLTGFRTKEFNFLLQNIFDSKLISMSNLIFKYTDLEERVKTKDIVWSTPMSEEYWRKRRKEYCKHFNMKKNQFQYMQNRKYFANGAYIMFLYNTYLSLQFLEKNSIPFVFTLFPGGGFRLNHEFSDKMMKDVFSSPMFRGCFVPQKIIYEYILEKNFTTKDRLFYEYGGGFFQFIKEDVLPKKYYLEDKHTFDIAFVAYRYMPKGLDKGFDLVVYSLKQLIKKYPFIHLHCVGTNTLDDFEDDFLDIQDNIHFYGSQRFDFFPKFYQNMDIALAPNRSNKLDKGAFDGFPLMCEAGFFGVPIFCSDELGLNNNYIDKQDLIIIKPDIGDIVQHIDYYIKNLSELRKIGINGQNKIQKLFDIKKQEEDRLNFINKYLNITINSK